MFKTILIISLLIFIGYSYAANLSQPPVLKDEPLAEQQYLKEIADNFNNLEEVTTNPDGSRKGRYKDVVLLKSGSSYYIEVCISSPNGTTWRGVALSDVP